mmetsp:Transcript_63853/g.170795  ORF Transcript_63853/g.170795 Transcript_63853/m.170795 type:complete len:235 (-) Transcript_63853:97-801(-)
MARPTCSLQSAPSSGRRPTLKKAVRGLLEPAGRRGRCGLRRPQRLPGRARGAARHAASVWGHAGHCCHAAVFPVRRGASGGLRHAASRPARRGALGRAGYRAGFIARRGCHWRHSSPAARLGAGYGPGDGQPVLLQPGHRREQLDGAGGSRRPRGLAARPGGPRRACRGARRAAGRSAHSIGRSCDAAGCGSRAVPRMGVHPRRGERKGLLLQPRHRPVQLDSCIVPGTAKCDQ